MGSREFCSPQGSTKAILTTTSSAAGASVGSVASGVAVPLQEVSKNTAMIRNEKIRIVLLIYILLRYQMDGNLTSFTDLNDLISFLLHPPFERKTCGSLNLPLSVSNGAFVCEVLDTT
jgi:hypothetical protein